MRSNQATYSGHSCADCPELLRRIVVDALQGSGDWAGLGIRRIARNFSQQERVYFFRLLSAHILSTARAIPIQTSSASSKTRALGTASWAWSTTLTARKVKQSLPQRNASSRRSKPMCCLRCQLNSVISIHRQFVRAHKTIPPFMAAGNASRLMSLAIGQRMST